MASFWKNMNTKLRRLDLPYGDWESYSDKQVLHKAGANNSGICRVSLKVGRSISWPLANAGANGYK